ncbi:divalent-cation tolerance protein CutA [Candidatus Uabimicrobium amorphum]|uniref:Divalent ion tolerance protein CutA n=1 Tax=Uabimicrobium amorphum TaxID=2596890 RepID=A0A5S9IHJ6_UABAM|nr:divalent cation tolerance protein CutA [Candidatus Uabimicrobium amorphum]BBM81893.1 divalent ion tolerance protein CutA [Candidatus Uabimicrobium amorphum]
MKVVLCNCPPDKAEEIAKELVESRVAACVNILPHVKSFYHWDGKLCCDEEKTLLIKIRGHDFRVLQQKILQLHPNDVPEIVELNVSNVNAEYLKWLYASTGGEDA